MKPGHEEKAHAQGVAQVSPWLHALLEHRLFVGLVALYAALGLACEALGVIPGFRSRVLYLPAYSLSIFLVWYPPLVTLVRERFAVRDANGARMNGWAGWVAGWRAARAGPLRSERVLGFALVALLVPVLLNAFGAWKALIPVLHPFAIDAQLASLDRALHLGRDPWRWLHPWLGHPSVTRAIDVIYWTWIIWIPLIVIWQAWDTDQVRRRRFFLAFVLSWIVLGTGFATLLSSAGPCFYKYLVPGPDPYAPLLGYLDQIHVQTPLEARRWQTVLWVVYKMPTPDPYTRISAMPSMHVAIPVLYTLSAWPRSRWMGTLCAAFTLVILVGSVHLGWHYAVDGEVSVLAMCGLWWLAGRITRYLDHG
jgi:PAP2 superfamily protein